LLRIIYVSQRTGVFNGNRGFLDGSSSSKRQICGKIEPLIAPVKDMFAAMFFVSIGALIDIGQFRVFLVPALLITALMVVGK